MGSLLTGGAVSRDAMCPVGQRESNSHPPYRGITPPRQHREQYGKWPKKKSPGPSLHTGVTQLRDRKGTDCPAVLGGILSPGYGAVPIPQVLQFFDFSWSFSLHCPKRFSFFVFPSAVKTQRNRNSIADNLSFSDYCLRIMGNGRFHQLNQVFL